MLGFLLALFIDPVNLDIYEDTLTWENRTEIGEFLPDATRLFGVPEARGGYCRWDKGSFIVADAVDGEYRVRVVLDGRCEGKELGFRFAGKTTGTAFEKKLLFPVNDEEREAVFRLALPEEPNAMDFAVSDDRFEARWRIEEPGLVFSSGVTSLVPVTSFTIED